VAEALAAALLGEGGWYADIDVGDDKIVIFADRVFPIPTRRLRRPAMQRSSTGDASVCRISSSTGSNRSPTFWRPPSALQQTVLVPAELPGLRLHGGVAGYSSRFAQRVGP
jgi:hypothetical protein